MSEAMREMSLEEAANQYGPQHRAAKELVALRAELAEANEQLAKMPKLSVVYGPMPESNGKSNFTAILCRDGNIYDGFTIARSEYPDRVRYDADCVRHLIGELPERPDLMDYDGDKHSGYAEPKAAPVPAAVPDGVARFLDYVRVIASDGDWEYGDDRDDGHRMSNDAGELIAMLSAQSAPKPEAPFAPDWAGYRQGFADGKAEADASNAEAIDTTRDVIFEAVRRRWGRTYVRVLQAEIGRMADEQDGK